MSTAGTPPLGFSLLLGLVQGLTEFLPISSSGHLAAAQLLWPELGHPGVTLEIAVHVGTTAAVLLYYRRLLVSLVRGEAEAMEGLSRPRWLGYLVAGTVPTAAIGLGGERFFRASFESIRVVAVCLAITGAVLWISRARRGAGSLTAPRAVAVGVVQGAAILPGLSRSGLTISLALLLGVAPRQAVTFSLLLSVPAIVGAAILDLRHLLGEAVLTPSLFLNFASATLCAGGVGYACIGLVHRATRGGWWHRFAWYCWSLALILAWATG